MADNSDEPGSFHDEYEWVDEYDDHHAKMNRAANGIPRAALTAVVEVFCGIGDGRTRSCGGRIGTLERSGASLVWRPAVSRDDAPDGAIGAWPVLLPSSIGPEIGRAHV